MSKSNSNSQIVVVRIIDDFTLVLNSGLEDGIIKGDKFLVYYLEPEEITDPITGESLGNLEIVRGSGSVTHVQARMCTIKSNKFEIGGRIIRRATSGIRVLLGESIEEEESEKRPVPFEYPQVGDFAKQI